MPLSRIACGKRTLILGQTCHSSYSEVNECVSERSNYVINYKVTHDISKLATQQQTVLTVPEVLSLI